MKHRSVMFLIVALALLLAPMAAYAAPTPAGFDATGSVGTFQPPRRRTRPSRNKPSALCWIMSKSAA